MVEADAPSLMGGLSWIASAFAIIEAPANMTLEQIILRTAAKNRTSKWMIRPFTTNKYVAQRVQGSTAHDETLEEKTGKI
jgi:hypothetical protein